MAMPILSNLRHRLEAWLAAKAIGRAFVVLEAKHLGTQLRAWLDDKYGVKESQLARQHMVAWMQSVEHELMTP